jgi:hypothetical protein
MVKSISPSYWRPALPNLKDVFESQRAALMGQILQR